jgi:DNA gyrase subunit A
MTDMDMITPATGAGTGGGGGEDGEGAVSVAGVDGVGIEEAYVLVITQRGYGKRISIDEFRTQKRGGKGVIIIKFKSATAKEGGDELSCLRICRPGDEVVLSTSKGSVMRQRVNNISLQGRAATGVLIQSLAADDSIATVDLVPPLLQEEEAREAEEEILLQQKRAEKEEKSAAAALATA